MRLKQSRIGKQRIKNCESGYLSVDTTEVRLIVMNI